MCLRLFVWQRNTLEDSSFLLDWWPFTTLLLNNTFWLCYWEKAVMFWTTLNILGSFKLLCWPGQLSPAYCCLLIHLPACWLPNHLAACSLPNLLAACWLTTWLPADYLTTFLIFIFVLRSIHTVCALRDQRVVWMPISTFSCLYVEPRRRWFSVTTDNKAFWIWIWIWLPADYLTTWLPAD